MIKLNIYKIVEEKESLKENLEKLSLNNPMIARNYLEKNMTYIVNMCKEHINNGEQVNLEKMNYGKLSFWMQFLKQLSKVTSVESVHNNLFLNGMNYKMLDEKDSEYTYFRLALLSIKK